MEEIRIIKSSDGTFGVRQGDRWRMGLAQEPAILMTENLILGFRVPSLMDRKWHLANRGDKPREHWAWPGEFSFCEGCEKLVGGSDWTPEEDGDYLHYCGDSSLCSACVHDLKQEWDEKGPECHECNERKGWRNSPYFIDDFGEEIYCESCMNYFGYIVNDELMNRSYRLIDPPRRDSDGRQDGPRDPGDAELPTTDDHPGDLPQVLPQERHREAEAGVAGGEGEGDQDREGGVEAGGNSLPDHDPLK
jgi:hypothetical protein